MIPSPGVLPPTSTRQGKKLVLLFGADIKVAGSLSLAVSLPTMLVGFTHPPELVVLVGDGGWFSFGDLRRRPSPWVGTQLHPTTAARRASSALGREGVAALVGRADCPRCPSSEDLLTVLVPAGHLRGACAARHRERTRLALLGRVTG
jgi:hypothetical protein